jgi:hypothetical protein
LFLDELPRYAFMRALDEHLLELLGAHDNNSLVQIICQTYIIERRKTAGLSTAYEAKQLLCGFSTSREQLDTLSGFFNWAFVCLYRVMCRKLQEYPESDIGGILLELYRIDEDAFYLDEKFDFTWEDRFPSQADWPKAYMSNLIEDVVLARIIKRHGAELLKIWVEVPRETPAP